MEGQMLWAVIASAVFVGVFLAFVFVNFFEHFINQRRFRRFEARFRPGQDETDKLKSVVSPKP